MHLTSADEAAYWDSGMMSPDAYDGAGFDEDLGSEEEVDLLGLRPASTMEHVFVANRERDTLTRINVPSLDVLTVSVGNEPTTVATTTDHSRAVTFNIGSADLSVVDAQTLSVTTIPIRPSLNRMSLSPDGRWAICMHDLAYRDENWQDPSGALSYNEISIVDLETSTHHETVVGSFPHDVVFSDDGALAVVVSDDYAAIIDLSEAVPTTDRVDLSGDVQDTPAAEEILLTPDGQWAFVRQYGVDNLKLIALDSGELSSIQAGLNPTDMDLTVDGSTAVVVARDSSELWLFDLTDPTDVPEVISMPDGEVFGSVLMSPDGQRGLLYSTVSGESRLGVWDRDSDEITVKSLIKPLSSVGISADGEVALLFHPAEENGQLSSDDPFYDHHAVTLLDLDSQFPNPIRLPAAPLAYDNTSDGLTGFLVTEGESSLQVLNYATLIHDEVIIPSEPVFLGVLPESDMAYISQKHSLGRISFYGASTRQLQTVTGFALNAAIEQ